MTGRSKGHLAGFRPRLRRTAFALALVTVTASSAAAQSTDNLLLVVNEDSQASAQIGAYYAQKRGVPEGRIVRLKAPETESISRAEYVRLVESPIARFLARNALQDRILYIVLTKGVPLRIDGTVGLQGSMSSVDSELAVLYRKMYGGDAPVLGRIENPYFASDKPLGEAKPFTRFVADIYLVTRLDGFTVDDVLKLIDRGISPVRDGQIVLDQKATVLDRGGDRWLEEAAARLRTANAGDRVVLDRTRALAETASPVLGYFSWGSNDPANQLRRFGLTFAPGAIAGMFVSSDGRTFAEPPAEWKPSDPNGGPVFGGSFQSLAGDLIRDGITGVSGHVAEPFLDATIRPQILFPAYLAGFNLAETYYLSMPFLSWQTVIVGDPLCTPFPRNALRDDQIHKGIDPSTELPALFSDRGLAVYSRSGELNQDAVRIVLRANAKRQRDENANVEAELAKAVEMEPRLTGVAFEVASIEESRGEHDKAIARYRKILDVNPNDFLALNNLAYSLAVHKQNPREALPFAERAYKVARLPAIADTLGWIRHLLGDNVAALPLVEQAVAGSPNNAELRFHLAAVHAGLKNMSRAAAELANVEKLDPKFAERADFKALKAIVK